MAEEAVVELGRPLAIVTPTLDGDVLAQLARHDVAFTAGQLGRVLTQHSEDGIRKVLQRLTRQGIVLSERVGQAYSYRLNRDHLAAGHIVALSNLATTFLEALTGRLESWDPKPVYAAVFGSAARGTMKAESDVDLLLVRPDNAPEETWDAQVDELVTDVSRWLGNDARPVQYTKRELMERATDDPLLRDVLQEGLTVAGTRAWLSRRLRPPKV